jgi:hypothetical protein
MEAPPSPQTIPRPTIQSDHSINQLPVEVTQQEVDLNNSNLNNTTDGFDELESDCNSVHTNSNSYTAASTTDILQDKYVCLYHENRSYMVLQQYCVPISIVDPDLCKYPLRNSIVRRSKILKSGTQLTDVSPTVYMPDRNENKKNQYTKLDRRYVQCFMGNCVDSNTFSAKIVHFSCHVHNVN